jgi:hypothetical protein
MPKIDYKMMTEKLFNKFSDHFNKKPWLVTGKTEDPMKKEKEAHEFMFGDNGAWRC